MKKYDAIVIGAGNGGLVAACKLAKEGKKALLLERHNVPGGSATSFVRGRFEFEASLHELCGIGPRTGIGMSLDIFKDLGVADRMEWASLDEAFRIISLNPDEKADYSLPIGKENFIKAVEGYCPGSRKYTEKLFEMVEAVQAGVDYMTTITDFEGRIIKDVLTTHRRFLNSVSYTVEEIFDWLNVPQTVRDCFAGYWLYLGTSLDKLSFTHYATMFYSYIIDGSVVPLNRSHYMSSVILDRFEELGGEVRFGAEVAKVLLTEGRASGVRLADGSELFADYIICNASPYNLYTKLLDKEDIPESKLKRLNSLALAPKGFSLFLGLDASPEELGINDHSYFIFDTMDTAKQVELTRSRATNGMQAAVCLNKGVPDCSPEGTTILYITSIYTGESAWNGLTEENYVSEKRKVAERTIANFEKATGVKIRGHIEEIEIATPVTYARYLDAPNGDIYGFENTRDYDIVTRIIFGLMGENIPRLYYGGGYGRQSIGFNPSYLSGYDAAKAALADMAKEEESK